MFWVCVLVLGLGCWECFDLWYWFWEVLCVFWFWKVEFLGGLRNGVKV